MRKIIFRGKRKPSVMEDDSKIPFVYGDLMFEVVNNEERGIYTYLEYMTIMILTLGMEVIVLFRKKEEVNEEK